MSHLPYGPTAYFTLTNVVMRHDIPSVGTMSEVFPHLIFDNFTTKLGKRVNTFVIFFVSVHIPLLSTLVIACGEHFDCLTRIRLWQLQDQCYLLLTVFVVCLCFSNNNGCKVGVFCMLFLLLEI